MKMTLHVRASHQVCLLAGWAGSHTADYTVHRCLLLGVAELLARRATLCAVSAAAYCNDYWKDGPRAVLFQDLRLTLQNAYIVRVLYNTVYLM